MKKCDARCAFRLASFRALRGRSGASRDPNTYVSARRRGCRKDLTLFDIPDQFGLSSRYFFGDAAGDAAGDVAVDVAGADGASAFLQKPSLPLVTTTQFVSFSRCFIP